jgi:hypothetical protein
MIYYVYGFDREKHEYKIRPFILNKGFPAMAKPLLTATPGTTLTDESRFITSDLYGEIFMALFDEEKRAPWEKLISYKG